MKTLLILIMCLVSVPVFSQGSSATMNELNSLYESKQYFRMNELFNHKSGELGEWQSVYYRALLDNLFNKPEASNSGIDKLMSEYKDDLTDSMEMNLYTCKLINSVNLFQYKDAYEVTEILLSQYGSKLEKDEIEDFENSGLIWKAGIDLKPQTVEVSADTKLETKKDMAGMTNIKVNINGIDENFIFDTGANFSTISESYAKKLQLKFLEGKLMVGAITGKEVSTNLAYAEILKIGNLTFHNVLFLVVPDESLSFGGGVYVINGILGFPVIKEMKEIWISENEIFIPNKITTSVNSNLAMDGFIPLIETFVNKDTLVFSFDTGARKTIMYFPFYEKYEKLIDSTYEPEEIKMEGAGGEVRIKGFMLNDLNFRVSDSKARLDSVSLLSQKIEEKDKYIFGNLGRDFINRFSEMKINFEEMYVEFEK